MGEISAEITNTIYFSTQNPIKNDFGITISYKKGISKANIQALDPNAPLIIYILGLEQLFKNNDEMINFAKSLNIHQDEGWNVSSNDDNELVVTSSAQKLESDFSIHFHTYYEFNKDFKDNDCFLIKTLFDIPYSNRLQKAWEKHSITAYEMPWIESISVINSKGIETSSIIKGKKANIQWKTNVESSNQGSVVLYDENKKEQKTNEFIIDKDRIFTLVVTKHEKKIFQKIPIKAIYIDKLEVQDLNGNVTKAVYEGDVAKICWSVVNGESARTILADDRGDVAISSPYTTIIERDVFYNLRVDQDGVAIYQVLKVFCTLWEKKPKYLNIPFHLENLSYNKIIRISEDSENDGYYLYIHPYLYYSTDLLEWKQFPNANEPFHHQMYYNSTLSIIDKQQSIVTCHIDDFDIIIRSYDLHTNQWETDLYRPKIDFIGCKDEKLLFCHLMKYKCQLDDIYDSLFVVHEHSIYVRDIYEGYDIRCCIKLPEDAGSKPTIISIDTVADYQHYKNYLAILCDDCYVYVYEADCFFKHPNFKCKAQLRKYQKNVYLVKTDLIYVVTDHHQFMLEGNNLKEKWFAPREQTLANPMFVGQKNESAFSAMIKEDNCLALWTYNPT